MDLGREITGEVFQTERFNRLMGETMIGESVYMDPDAGYDDMLAEMYQRAVEATADVWGEWVDEIAEDHPEQAWLTERSSEGQLLLMDFLGRLPKLQHLYIDNFPVVDSDNHNFELLGDDFEHKIAELDFLSLYQTDTLSFAQRVLNSPTNITTLQLGGRSLKLKFPSDLPILHLSLIGLESERGYGEDCSITFQDTLETLKLSLRCRVPPSFIRSTDLSFPVLRSIHLQVINLGFDVKSIQQLLASAPNLQRFTIVYTLQGTGQTDPKPFPSLDMFTPLLPATLTIIKISIFSPYPANSSDFITQLITKLSSYETIRRIISAVSKFPALKSIQLPASKLSTANAKKLEAMDLPGIDLHISQIAKARFPAGQGTTEFECYED